MHVIVKLFYLFAFAGALIGALDFIGMIGIAESAPQQAAAAAMAMAWAVIPYVLARALEKMGASSPPK
jgi:hypothetical protein